MQQIVVYPGGQAATIDLGRQGEVLVREVVFRLEGWAGWDEGCVQLLLRRQGDEAPFPCPLIQEADAARWQIGPLETERAGDGWAELRYVRGGTVLKSTRFPVRVAESLTGGLSGQPSGVAKNWLDRLLEQGRTAVHEVTSMAEGLLAGYVSQARQARVSAEQAGARAEAAAEIAVPAGELAAAARDEAVPAGALAARSAQSASADAADARYYAGLAQAEADRATVPAVQGVYNTILQDRDNGTRWALIVEGGALKLLEVSPALDAADLALVDQTSGTAYALIVESGTLKLEEV